MNTLPLKGLIVLEFSQYLAGPSIGLRLADLGARVIKIERPGTGDPARKMSIKNLWVEEDSLLFHTINRNKESFEANLKNETDLETVRTLIAKADVITHSFRPGVMEKIGLDYDQVQKINSGIIYLQISGYGDRGPWKDKPGQDLLVQSLSGLAYTTGNSTDGPVPIGISVVDEFCGAQGTQAVLGALIKRQKTGIGVFLEISLFESAVSMQFELLTTFYNSEKEMKRSEFNNGSPLLGAPYGIYKTSDEYIALAMMDLEVLEKAMETDILKNHRAEEGFSHRDEIKKRIAEALMTQSADYWIDKLSEYGLWAAKVFDWQDIRREKAYDELQMEQKINLKHGGHFITTRCPIRINRQLNLSDVPAPGLGEQTEKIKKEIEKSIV